MVREVMQAAGAGFADIERIAVTLGPGSFTGVRTGISAARAMALATGVPVCGVSSLELMRWGAEALAGEKLAGRPSVVAVDARRGEVYLQRFTVNGTAAAPKVLPIAVALKDMPSGSICLGSGGPLLEAAAAAAGVTPPALLLPDLEPDAAALVERAASLPILTAVLPLYLRPPDAKPQTSKILPRV